MDKEQMISYCMELGCHAAAVLPVSEIPFDPGLREYCRKNTCRMYGTNYGCPPLAGGEYELIKRAKGYGEILVFQAVFGLEDSFDFEGMVEAGKKHEQTAEAIFAGIRKAYPDGICLTAGGCKICEVCAAGTGEACRFPQRSLSSLEAYCINVSELSAKCGMKYINGVNTVTYFGGVLF